VGYYKFIKTGYCKKQQRHGIDNPEVKIRLCNSTGKKSKYYPAGKKKCYYSKKHFIPEIK
jgi:hypothetical protein